MENLEVMTTSIRSQDIVIHNKYFKPNVFLYCLYHMAPDQFGELEKLKPYLSVLISLIIFGFIDQFLDLMDQFMVQACVIPGSQRRDLHCQCVQFEKDLLVEGDR